MHINRPANERPDLLRKKLRALSVLQLKCRSLVKTEHAGASMLQSCEIAQAHDVVKITSVKLFLISERRDTGLLLGVYSAVF